MKATRSMLLGAALVLAGATLPLVASVDMASATVTMSVAPGSGDGAGSCAGTSCTTLRAAVDFANAHAGTVISLGSGSYELTTGSLKITAPMSIVGKAQGGPSVTIIRQKDGVSRVLEINAIGLVTIANAEVTGGVATSDPNTHDSDSRRAEGGGIYSQQASLRLTNVRVYHNMAVGDTGVTDWASGYGESAAGGGVYANEYNGGVQPADVVITGSSIDHNTAQGGKAVTFTTWAAPGGPAFGGGVDFENGPLTMTDTTVASNAAIGGAGTATNVVCDDVNHYCDGGWAFGGGVYTSNSPQIAANRSTFDRSTFVDNQALGGGAGSVPPHGQPASAGPFGGDADGGGLFRPSSVTNSTVVGNQAIAGESPSPLRPPTIVSGSARGGGISQPGELRADTINGNHVDGTNDDRDGYGGGNVALQPAQGFGGSGFPVAIADTILSHGTAGLFSTPDNCLIFPQFGTSYYWYFQDDGSNLESTTPSQCGLGKAGSVGDKIGVDPKLVALASNGGPTQTEALGTGSPALSAAELNGGCLHLDQRSQVRPDARCDIGAYQHQVPVANYPSTITVLKVTVGHGYVTMKILVTHMIGSKAYPSAGKLYLSRYHVSGSAHGTLIKGVVTLTMNKQAKGTHKYVISYTGSGTAFPPTHKYVNATIK